MDDLYTFRFFQINGKATFISIERKELGTLAIDERCPVPCLIAVAWLFNFDDLGTHVSHKHGTEGPGQCAGQVYYLDLVQRRGHIISPEVSIDRVHSGVPTR